MTMNFYEDGINPILYVYQPDPPVQQRWDADRGWGDTNAISAMLFVGEGFYDEISQVAAKQKYPGAWTADGPLKGTGATPDATDPDADGDDDTDSTDDTDDDAVDAATK
jgi:hypothetical protein